MTTLATQRARRAFGSALASTSEPRKTRASGMVTGVTTDANGLLTRANVSVNGATISVNIPFGMSVYSGMTVALTNNGTPSNARWQVSGTTVPTGVTGGTITNPSGAITQIFDSIWVRNDGYVMIGGDIDLDGSPAGPRIVGTRCGWKGYDDYEQVSMAIYTAYCDDRNPGDQILGRASGARVEILPLDEQVAMYGAGGTPVFSFGSGGNFMRDPVTIGNPVGARINLGEIDGKATFVLRDKHGVAKLVARTDDSNDVFFYVGNPPPQDNSMWFDSADGVLNVNGVFAGSVYSNDGEIGGWNISATGIVSPNGYMALDPVEGLVLRVVDEVASGLEGSSPEGSNDPDYFRAISFIEDGVTLPLHRIYAARQQASGAEVNSLLIASQAVGDANSRAATWVSAISDMEAKTVIRAIGGYDTDDQAVTQILLYAYRAEHNGTFDYRRIDIESDGLHIKSTPITSFAGTVPAGTIVHSDGTFDPGGLGSGLYTYIAGDWKMLASNTPDLETKSADFTAAGAKVYLCNTGSNNITVSLPDASKLPDGWTYTVKKINASNTVTIDPSGTQQIDGSAASRTLTNNWSYLTIAARPGASAWYIIASESGAIALNTLNASYTVTDSDTIVVCDRATATTVALPPASGSGRILKIKSIGIGVVTVDGSGTDTIDGQETQTLTQWDSVTIVDYASNKWVIV